MTFWKILDPLSPVRDDGYLNKRRDILYHAAAEPMFAGSWKLEVFDDRMASINLPAGSCFYPAALERLWRSGNYDMSLAKSPRRKNYCRCSNGVGCGLSGKRKICIGPVRGTMMMPEESSRLEVAMT
jgi:hypothetical protein